jgi:hypothetical protein
VSTRLRKWSTLRLVSILGLASNLCVGFPSLRFVFFDQSSACNFHLHNTCYHFPARSSLAEFEYPIIFRKEYKLWSSLYDFSILSVVVMNMVMTEKSGHHFAVYTPRVVPFFIQTLRQLLMRNRKRTIMNYEFWRMWKDTVVAYFKNFETRRVQGSRLGQFIWDMWWTTWH